MAKKGLIGTETGRLHVGVVVVSFWLLLLAAGGCVYPLEDNGKGVSTSLVVSLKSAGDPNPSTKMTSTITQSDGSSFRGIEEIIVVPFKTDNDGAVTRGMARFGNQNVAFQNPGISVLVERNNSHLFHMVTMPMYMNHVLVYGKAKDSGTGTTLERNHRNGVLNPVALDDPSSSDDISFCLQPVMNIQDSLDVEATAEALIAALNGVVNVIHTTGDVHLLSIIEAIERENQIQACSYRTLHQIENQIINGMHEYGSAADPDAVNAAMSALSTLESALRSAGNTFPASYGIPEGALGFWWNGSQFVRLINGVNIALISLRNYCYPPSLWYYANSTIRTSNKDNVAAQYSSENRYWSDILSHYTDGGTVVSSTRSAAVVDSLQYGVGMLELRLRAEGNNDIAAALGCPLTGLIVGDQKDVDFSFNPVTSQNAGSRFLYDNVLGTDGSVSLSTTESVYMETLVLPTQAGQSVHFALEFQNTTGTTLHCQQGDILPLCRFYLAGILELDPDDPSVQPDHEILSSIFCQDHRTTVNAKAVSLNNAYNTVPDLREPQLEIGIVAELKWESIAPVSVKLNL